MATSLAEQLKKLSVPQTNLLNNDKKKTSLLFDPKDAASLRKETVYEIGLEGLEDLITKNGVFRQFKNTLFHITSKNFERSIQTKEANKKTDKNVNKFLLLLSPYFLTNAAHKALEWLYHRFIIDEYNRKELLMLVLPYHNSNIFVKVLQTLKFKNEGDPFSFLKPLQKPGLHLPKQNLLNNASTNMTFLKCISKYINQLIDSHDNPNLLTVQFNFYCTVFLGAIEYSTEIPEDLVSQMLPLILKGLNSSIPDFAAASYVVTARLLVKRLFSDKLLNNIVKKLSIVKCGTLKLEATLVMLVVYQSQHQYTDLPAKGLSNLSVKEWLPSCLEYLNSNGNNIYPFLQVLIKKAAEEGANNNLELPRELVVNILNEVKLDDFFVKSFLSTIMDVVDHKIVYSKEAHQWLCDIVNKLEVQYPSNFDQVVGEILSKGDGSLERKTTLQRILGHVVANKENAEVFNNLYHTREEIRQQALKCLCKKYISLKASEQELFKNYLINRLYDENPKIVEKTLNLLLKLNIKKDQLLQNVLTGIFKKDKLLQKRWNDVFILASNFLCANKEFSWEIFLSVFPLITLYSDKKLKHLKKLFKLDFFSSHKLFVELSEKVAPLYDCKEFMANFLACFDSNADTQLIKDFLEFLNDHLQEDCVSQYSAIFILSHMIPNSCLPETSTSVIQFIKRIDISKHIISEDTSTLKGYLEICLKNKVPLEGMKNCIEKVILKTIKPNKNWELIDFSKDTADSIFLQNLFSLVFSDVRLENLLEKYLNAISSSVNTKITFCLNMCVSETITENCITNVLTFIENLLVAKDHTEDFVIVDNFTVSYLLVLLGNTNTNAEVRKSVFHLIDFLSASLKVKDKNYLSFLQQMLKYREEIILDHEQTSFIIHNLLAPSNTKTKNSIIETGLILSDLLKVACNNLTPVYLKSGILAVLSHINNYEIYENLCNSLDLYENNEVIDKYKSNILLQLINRLDSQVISEVTLKSNIWKFVKHALNSKKTLIINDQKTYLTGLMLNQITKDVYALLSEELLQELLDIICEVSVTLEEPEVLALSSKIYKHLDLNAKLIIYILEKMKEVQLNKTADLKKKRRIHIVPTVDILDTLEWKKGMSVLEFLQGKKKIRNGECLLPLLFDILKKCLDFEEQAAVEYPKQLILSLILLICSKVEKETVPKNVFNIELVIQCIRASQNPQTHHHALLLLANTAELVPTEVLHHIMAVFTFMGSSLIRHDDAYSFQIISKIIDTIIPILVRGGDLNAIVKVLGVFANAILDVPEHRRIPLYKQLVNKVGAKENLYFFLLLIFEAQILHASHEKQKAEKGGLLPRLKIAQDICLDFPPKITLGSCIQLVKYLRQLPDQKEDISEKETFMCNAHYTAKQFRHYKYLIVTFITSFLSSQKFVHEIAELTDEDNLQMEDLYKELIVTILTYIQRIQKVSEKACNTQQAQYWKTVLYHSYDILDSVNALLTPQMFLLVIKGLLMHNIQTVKRRALELLNSKLQLNPQYFDNCVDSEMCALIPPVITIIEILNSEHMIAENEILVQTALLSLKLLVKSLKSDEPEKIIKILEFITSILRSGKIQNNVLASVILCLVELCVHLRAHAISCLADFMPAFLRILKNQKHQEVSSLLLLSVVTAVNKLLDSLSLFLSPYLQKIIYETSILISKWGCATKDQKLVALVGKLNSIKQKIGSCMPPRVLIPAIENCYDNLVQKIHFKAIGALMDIFAESVNHLPVKDINLYMQELTNLFLKALQFRSDNDVTLEDANLVEEQIVKALTVLVLKLSESTFRPLFLKLYDWAARSEGKSDRLITFYNLAQNIARSLKALFVLFANHFLNNASQILIKINKSTSEESYFDDELKNILLLEFVLKTLHTVFTYDNQNFVNKNRFDLLMQPLADQLENTIGGITSLVKRNESLLTPTIVHFLIAVADDALWKQMNYQILLKMRNSTPDIRLAALHCLTEVVNKLGEDFLPLLPETIPFLAELLEDEEEKVEKACQKAIHEMEKVLGEPLQKYF